MDMLIETYAEVNYLTTEQVKKGNQKRVDRREYAI